MLDQNTDRMWYVIGAVLIGAAIIFGMNTLMPNAFASVTELFEDTTSQVRVDISYNTKNLINSDDVTKGAGLNVSTGDLSYGAANPHHAYSDYMPVGEHQSYTFYIPGHKHTTALVFYDRDYNRLDGWNAHGVEIFTYTAPENARYARVSGRVEANTGEVDPELWWFGLTEDFDTMMGSE